MSDQFVVPEHLRGGRFVPRQAPGRRQPARVTAGAFRARGLDAPQDPALWNAYQLSERRGFPWSPAIDAHIARRGAELLGGDQLICVDIDVALAVDGSIWMDGFRRACDLAAGAGTLLDLSAGCVAVRTPGNGTHGRGWHLWYRAGSDSRVRLGPLQRCPLVEIKSRATSPGTPGYELRSAPDGDLGALPAWLAALAPPRPVHAGRSGSKGGAPVWRRLEGIVDFLCELSEGDGRNRWLYWGACRCAEMTAAGDLDAASAERVLLRAAHDNGHVAKHGVAATLATIRSGLRTAVAA